MALRKGYGLHGYTETERREMFDTSFEALLKEFADKEFGCREWRPVIRPLCVYPVYDHLMLILRTIGVVLVVSGHTGSTVYRMVDEYVARCLWSDYKDRRFGEL